MCRKIAAGGPWEAVGEGYTAGDGEVKKSSEVKTLLLGLHHLLLHAFTMF